MARPGLRKHPKFLRLCHMLGEPGPHVQGHLEWLWETGYENGDDRLGDATDVELVSGADGEPRKLFEALLACGFIEPDPQRPGKFRIHDLYDHAPDYVKKRMHRELERRQKGLTLQEIRSNAARQAAEARWQQTDATRLPSDASRMPCGMTPAPAPAPAPTRAPDVALPSEACSEPDKPATEPPSAVLIYPCVGKGPKTWGLMPEKLAEFRECYPGIDVLAECRKALQWCRDNASKQKTARGMPAFLNRWLAKAQNDQGQRANLGAAIPNLNFGDLGNDGK